MRARIGRSRLCPRVVECRCRSRQQMFWRREAGASISTDLEASGDGRLVPIVHARARTTGGKETSVPDQRGSSHVTALEIGPIRMDAAKLATEGTSGHLSGLLFTEHPRMRPWRRLGPRTHESDCVLGRSDRGVRGSAGSGAHGRERHARTRIARRSGWVRRETPDPPVSLSREASRGKRARRKLRRDAGNARGAGARKRSSGKQKSVGTHRSNERCACGLPERHRKGSAHGSVRRRKASGPGG
jgi:hypothetical protein